MYHNASTLLYCRIILAKPLRSASIGWGSICPFGQSCSSNVFLRAPANDADYKASKQRMVILVNCHGFHHTENQGYVIIRVRISCRILFARAHYLNSNFSQLENKLLCQGSNPRPWAWLCAFYSLKNGVLANSATTARLQTFFLLFLQTRKVKKMRKPESPQNYHKKMHIM